VSWQLLVAVVVALLVLGFLAVLLLVRDPVSRRIRVGLFVERNHERHERDPDKDDTVELPPR
jgi:hypothetical protein